MRPILECLVAFVSDNRAVPAPLTQAVDCFGIGPVREFCMRLLGWWYGELLSKPPWQLSPSLLLDEKHDWKRAFRSFVQSVPALAELVKCDPTGLHFADIVPAEELMGIQQRVRANYRPHFSVALR